MAYDEFTAKLVTENERLTEENEKLQAQLTTARQGNYALEQLINESDGVYGLHQNGDLSPWEELRYGGRFEEWLCDFDKALEQSDGS